MASKSLPRGVQKDPKIRVKVKSSALAVLDVTPKKKKKKKKSLVATTEKLFKRLSKTDPGVRSILGDNREAILQMIESGDSITAINSIYKGLLQSLVDVIPYAEHNVRETQGAKGVYQLNSLISSLREIATDMQSSQDRGHLGAAIVESILRPSYKDLAMTVLTEYKSMEDDVRSSLKALGTTSGDLEEEAAKEERIVRDLISKSRTRIADAMQAQYADSAARIVDYLQR